MTVVLPTEWLEAPEYVPVPVAAHLLGPAFDEKAVLWLIEDGAIDAERNDGQWVVETRSLGEYLDALEDLRSLAS